MHGLIIISLINKLKIVVKVSIFIIFCSSFLLSLNQLLLNFKKIVIFKISKHSNYFFQIMYGNTINDNILKNNFQNYTEIDKNIKYVDTESIKHSPVTLTNQKEAEVVSAHGKVTALTYNHTKEYNITFTINETTNALEGRDMPYNEEDYDYERVCFNFPFERSEDVSSRLVLQNGKYRSH